MAVPVCWVKKFAGMREDALGLAESVVDVVVGAEDDTDKDGD